MFLFGKQIRKLESTWDWIETNLFQPLYNKPTLKNGAKITLILIFIWPILLGILYGWVFLLIIISGIFWTKKDKMNFIKYNKAKAKFGEMKCQTIWKIL